MNLIELTLAHSQNPVVVNLTHVTEMRPASTGTDIHFAVPRGDSDDFGPDAVFVTEAYADIVRCIRATTASIPNVAAWAAALRDADPLAGWQAVELSPDLAAEIDAAMIADAARDARMDALEGGR